MAADDTTDRELDALEAALGRLAQRQAAERGASQGHQGHRAGEGTASPDGARIYKVSDLEDHSFYLAHKDDIKRAYNEGRIR